MRVRVRGGRGHARAVRGDSCMVRAPVFSSLRSWLAIALMASCVGCAADSRAEARSGLAPCDEYDTACDYGPVPQTVPVRGFDRVAFEPANAWGAQWHRGDEQLWVAKTRAPDYPVSEGGLRLRVEATRACRGQVPAVRKTFTLPPLDSATAMTVLFFELDGRAYQVGYARPLKRAAASDVSEFMARFCGA